MLRTSKQSNPSRYSPEPKVKVFIPMYEPLETTKCEKCGKANAELIESWNKN